MANASSQAALRIDRTLVLALTITFLASVGTGAITLGIYFLTESALGYGRVKNFAVALAMGLTYIVGAGGIGPALRRGAGRAGSTRRVAVILLAILGGVCLVPIIAAGGWAATPPAWSLWTTAVTFGIFSGSLWPIVESYISGGRRDANLRSSIGWFNIVWATAVIGSMWLIAPFVEHHPMLVLLWIGVLHFLAGILAFGLAPEPPRHLSDLPQVVPPRYRELLRVTRILLPSSYVLMSSLGPAIPAAIGALGVSLTWKAPLYSVWMCARVVTFVLLERRHGWHGRWWTPLVGGVATLLGFALAILSPRFADAGMAALIAALAAFGVGAGLIYVSSLYYGMEVGGGTVDDGGRHETFIGFGYAGGPACGLIASLAVPAESEARDLAIVLLVGLLGLLAVIASLVTALRSERIFRTSATE